MPIKIERTRSGVIQWLFDVIEYGHDFKTPLGERLRAADHLLRHMQPEIDGVERYDPNEVLLWSIYMNFISSNEVEDVKEVLSAIGIEPTEANIEKAVRLDEARIPREVEADKRLTDDA